LGHLAVGHTAAFDRIEFLVAAAEGWAGLRASRNLPADLVELLPLAWIRPYPEIRSRVVDVLCQIVADPFGWLRHLDALKDFSTTALGMFGGLLSQYQERLEEPLPVPHSPADLARLAAEFLDEVSHWGYGVIRPHLLAFCLREAVGAELVATVVPPTPTGGVSLQQAVPNDWPLRYVTWACRLAWV
jgi:hypothetical protein